MLSLARSTIFSSTTLSSSSANVQRDRPLGGSEQANAISLASAAPSKTRLRAEFGECLRVRTASRPSSTSAMDRSHPEPLSPPRREPLEHARALLNGEKVLHAEEPAHRDGMTGVVDCVALR